MFKNLFKIKSIGMTVLNFHSEALAIQKKQFFSVGDHEVTKQGLKEGNTFLKSIEAI